MTQETRLEAWKIFLKARIAQEQGRDQEALESFDQALALDPGNPYFLNSKAFAFARINRQEDALATRTSRQYGELAKRYVGEQDKPEPWIDGLKGLLGEIETFERAGARAAAVVAW